MQVNIELTDTYGGEANYSWVNRKSFEIDDKASTLSIVRKAKALLGVSGTKAKLRENYGDMIALWGLGGNCVVMFITFED